MRYRLTIAAAIASLGLVACTVRPGPIAVRAGVGVVYDEPYVVYRSGAPYVFYDGTYWPYGRYYRHYYGPTYVVPPPPTGGVHVSPPPPVVVFPPGHADGHGHDDDDD